MQAARKEEVFSMENEQAKIEGRLDRIEAVAVETKSKVQDIELRLIDTQGDVKELQSDVKGLTERVIQTQVGLKELDRRVTETQGEVKELRTRMEDAFHSLRKEISDAKIWALLIAATMLGVLARGFHWI
jgi:peptidoglycan hydrolase CwlO-like protein